MTELNTNENMLASLDRVMRLLRRGHSTNSHGGRSVYRMLAIIQRQEGISTRELAELLDCVLLPSMRSSLIWNTTNSSGGCVMSMINVFL